MSYADDLAKLKRATERNRNGPTHNYACAACGATPAPMTRFGPRCVNHRPHDENCAAIAIKSRRAQPCDCGREQGGGA